jgi:hypothetical protein
MQILGLGINPAFWMLVNAQPTGVYNKGIQQAPSAAIPQRLVAFVDLPIGTGVTFWINGQLKASGQVIDNTGLVFADLVFPYTRNIDTIEIQIRDSNNKILLQESFATSHIALFLSVQAQVFQPLLDNVIQLDQGTTIAGVGNDILEGKYGIYTGLTRRAEQTIDAYRAQTACLWQAFQYASMEKGLVDAIKCVLGATVTVTLEHSRDIVTNRVFDQIQFKGAGQFGEGTPPLPRLDPDSPHYYIADMPAAFRTEFPPGGSPIDVLGPFPGTPGDDYDSDTVRSFTIHTTEAVGHEVVVRDINESDAIVAITEEQITRRTSTIAPEGDSDGTDSDIMANAFIATPVSIVEAIISGSIIINPALLPVQGTDYRVDDLAGKIVWLASATIKPDPNTQYKVDYSFRLDASLDVVIRRIKPAHKSVVIIFENVTSSLPPALEV